MDDLSVESTKESMHPNITIKICLKRKKKGNTSVLNMTKEENILDK